MRLRHKRPFSKTLLRSATDERLEIGPKIVCRAVAKKFLISAPAGALTAGLAAFSSPPAGCTWPASDHWCGRSGLESAKAEVLPSQLGCNSLPDTCSTINKLAICSTVGLPNKGCACHHDTRSDCEYLMSSSHNGDANSQAQILSPPVAINPQTLAPPADRPGTASESPESP